MTRINRDWVIASALTIIAFIERIWSLGYPKGYVFDEVYYAKNAYSLLHHGVELTAPKNVAEFVVHPPIGKWIIAIGIKLFGYNEFGWRFMAAVIGSLSILVMYFTAKKLFNSQFLSIAASFLLLIDGLHLVHSRTALLDIFLMFFIQLAVLAILHEKYWWAGLALGLATATKWSGLYFLVALVIYLFVIEVNKYRYLGVDRPTLMTLKEKLPIRFVQFGLLPFASYMFSWTGWFATGDGWDRKYSKNILTSFLHYHQQILTFHANLSEKHPYMANPWGWLFMARPTSFYYQTPKNCGSSSCSSEVIALGTPLIYWTITVALFVVAALWFTSRDAKAGLILMTIAGGYLPWFLFQKRTMFTFYVISFEPFLMLLLIYLLYIYFDRAKDERELKKRKALAIAIGVVYAINFIYFMPLYYGATISYNSWFSHMWFASWI